MFVDAEGNFKPAATSIKENVKEAVLLTEENFLGVRLRGKIVPQPNIFLKCYQYGSGHV